MPKEHIVEAGLTKNEIIAALTRSDHGALEKYVPLTMTAAKQEPEFLAHLIAWNEMNGQIRDSRIALPVASLGEISFNGELADNSLAHIALLDPRMLLRAYSFARQIGTPKRGRKLRDLIERYLRVREANPHFWDRTALQHRRPMKRLYSLMHVKPNEHADDILFKGKKLGVFKDLVELRNLPATAIAAAIMKHRIPFLLLARELGARLKDPDIGLAMIAQMTPLEVVSNTKMLNKLGLKSVPALRAAYEAKMKEVADSKEAVFKTTRAAQAVNDEALKEKLIGAQEKQLARSASIEGDWLLLADRSGSMEAAIEGARQLASALTKMVKGKVYIVFFNTTPQIVDATGKDYPELLKATSRVNAVGGTSIGIGMTYALERKLNVDGIAILSDGGENTAPQFAHEYGLYAKQFDKRPPVYWYRMSPNMGAYRGIAGYASALDSEVHRFLDSCRQENIDVQQFDLRSGFDYYSLTNIAQTMRADRFSLIDQIMETPLMTLDGVFKSQLERVNEGR